MMKKAIVSALFVAVVAGGVQAQDHKPRRGGFKQNHYGMMQKLNLTDNQKAELKSIHQEFRQQMADLKKNEDITVREYKSRKQAIFQDHRTKMNKVYTPGQKATMEKMKQERKAKMQQRGKQRMEKMQKDLNLTPEQEKALKQQREQMKEKLKAIRENKSLTEEQKKAELKQFREQQHQSLKSILSEEQLKKLQQRKPHRPKRNL